MRLRGRCRHAALMAAAANDEEENNVLFNDLNGDYIGAYWVASTRAPVVRVVLTTQARAWPYY